MADNSNRQISQSKCEITERGAWAALQRQVASTQRKNGRDCNLIEREMEVAISLRQRRLQSHPKDFNLKTHGPVTGRAACLQCPVPPSPPPGPRLTSSAARFRHSATGKARATARPRAGGPRNSPALRHGRWPTHRCRGRSSHPDPPARAAHPRPARRRSTARAATALCGGEGVGEAVAGGLDHLCEMNSLCAVPGLQIRDVHCIHHYNHYVRFPAGGPDNLCEYVFTML
jgi:hypothetical protein